MEQDNLKQIMRKRNMKIFPTYKKLAWDYLFFYSIDFLFLTQVKNISAADIVLKSSFYALFSMFLQIPANIIVDFIGRKNSIVLGNFLNCFYIVILILSNSFPDLILAEFISAMAFSVKNISEPSLLNESIPVSKYKSKIFSKINSKGASGYFIYGAISKIIAGYLFIINGYLPMICSLIVLIISTILSMYFIEPLDKKNTQKNDANYLKSMIEIKEGFVYILKSNRLKALILSGALISALLKILQNYHVSLLKDMNIDAAKIGIISAIGSIIAALASKKQEKFHNKFRNKTLTIISLILSISCLISGVFGLYYEKSIIILGIAIIAIFGYKFCNGMYATVIDRYLRNFTNQKIDTKIFAASNLTTNSLRFFAGLIAAFLLNKMSTAYCMIIIGIAFTLIYILMGKYMRSRVGKKAEEYSVVERKYDELNKK